MSDLAAIVVLASLFLVVGTAGLACAIVALGRRYARKRLAILADLDGLTGLANRHAFDKAVADSVRRRGPHERYALAAIEIVDMDALYLRFGSHFGNKVIQALAERLHTSRKPDTVVARIGGAQFCSLDQIDGRDSALALAHRLRRTLMGDLVIEGRTLSVDIRIGAAIFPDDAHDADELMRRAFAALLRAVTNPIGTVTLYDEVADAAAQRRMALASDLRGALDRGELRLFYQPQVWIADGRVIGYEALLRWQHPQLGLISPAEFIPLAEQTGCIIAIGDWVLHTACAEAARWPDHLRVAVNISPLQLRQAPLAHRVADALAASGLDPDRLEIELTESSLVEDRAHALEVFARIKALGVRLALDDFGSGFSSMDVLRRFPFDKVKLDKSFVDEIEHSVRARAILHAMLALGRRLSIPVLAEGVETQQQLEILRGEGCKKVQGFLTGRPAPGIPAAASRPLALSV